MRDQARPGGFAASPAERSSMMPAVGTPRAVLVLGSPRSGTTMMGRYLGSSKRVCDLGEFNAFYFARKIAPREFEGFPGRFLNDYLDDLRTHALEFAQSVAVKESCEFYLDHSPWNLLLGKDLAGDVPDALFVLMLRHPRGVVESLRRSFDGGRPWAGEDEAARVNIWRRFYGKALELPSERTVAVSYDELCANPGPTIRDLECRIAAKGFSLGDLDPAVLAKSHATNSAHQRPVIARVDSRGRPEFSSIAHNRDVDRQWPLDPATAGLQSALTEKFQL
ncbi:sulfotransferase [Streptomyces sp. P9(2023)]|uniref:sulfotransferase family protein n=1 Tax=Streptomyces sp. P9(2023) TaxID=3064394 RepID=UPI0028F4366B|nr:sulfotransferase [Streptomyces sp. P9(2023)]